MAGKAITFIVNNYDTTGTSAADDTYTAPITYLVAGSARSTEDDPAPALRGDELVDGMVFKDDLRDTVPDDQTYWSSDGAKTEGTFASGRAAITANLLTRGGWRDHTDGNRISTTRGDAIDVVYGNYKLVVLGRITKSFDPAGNGGLGSAGNATENETLKHSFFDASGGHITEGTSAEGKIVSSIWRADVQDGSWQSVRQTDKGDRRSVYSGIVKRTFFGPSWTLSVGEGTDALAIDSGKNTAAGHAPERPDVTKTTRARSVVIREKVADKTEKATISGKYQRKVEVSKSYEKRAWAHSSSGRIVATTIKQDLMADHIELQSAARSFRVEAIGGIGRLGINTIGYWQTKTLGSLFDLQTLGLKMKVQGPLSAMMLIGTDTHFRIGPSVNKSVGSAMRLHLTFDLFGYLYTGLVNLFKKKTYVMDGDTVVIKIENHAASNAL